MREVQLYNLAMYVYTHQVDGYSYQKYECTHVTTSGLECKEVFAIVKMLWGCKNGGCGLFFLWKCRRYD